MGASTLSMGLVAPSSSRSLRLTPRLLGIAKSAGRRCAIAGRSPLPPISSSGTMVFDTHDVRNPPPLYNTVDGINPAPLDNFLITMLIITLVGLGNAGGVFFSFPFLRSSRRRKRKKNVDGNDKKT